MDLPEGLIEALPYYDLVPKDIEENLRFRIRVRERAMVDKKFRAALMQACSEDVLFFVNVFCWTYNPRDFPDQPNRPFVTWPRQDEILVGLEWAINSRKDVALPKSRQLGCTVVNMAFLAWRWQFRSQQSFVVTSYKEELVDQAGVPKELFFKLDYMHKWMPRWMLPAGRHLGRSDPNRPKNALINADNGSVIAGTATTPDIGRGDTLTMILNDEASKQAKSSEISKATRNATHTRVWNSTPNGRHGTGREFYLQAHNEANLIIKTHWSDHPEKDELAYTITDGKPYACRIEDQEYVEQYWEENSKLIDELRRKGYQLEGKRRSPYYDLQCSRSSDELEIAQEEDINFLVEGRTFFDDALLDQIRNTTVRTPMARGLLDVDSETLAPEWIPQTGGDWKIWCPLDEFNMPWNDREHFVGVDIASGLGGTSHSNSSIQVFNSTGEQVASYASNTVRPEKLAKLAIATCKWFCGPNGSGAKLNWETNGPYGTDFTQQVKAHGYMNVYYRTTGKEFTEKTTRIPGWGSGIDTKPRMFGTLLSALLKGECVIRDEDVVAELGEYVVDSGRNIVHSSSRTTDDESAKNEAHGDRVIAAAVAWIARDSIPRKILEEPKRIIRPGSIAWRRQEKQRLTRKQSKW